MINLLSISLVHFVLLSSKFLMLYLVQARYIVYGIHLSHLESAHCTDNRYGNDYKFAFN